MYSALRRAILRGSIATGKRLKEVELGERFKMSRTPIREALQRLEREHLLTNVPRRGLVVTEPEPEEINDIYLVRQALEGLGARLASERGTEIDFLRLDAQLDEIAEALNRRLLTARQLDRVIELNIRFDLDLFRVARSTRLVKLIDDLQSFPRRFRQSTLLYPGRAKEVLVEHRAILEAIRRRDADSAERAARTHIEKSRDIRIRMTLQRLNGSGRRTAPGALSRHKSDERTDGD